jgi:hypothetical protein
MSELTPQGENVRKAVKWISEKRQYEPETCGPPARLGGGPFQGRVFSLVLAGEGSRIGAPCFVWGRSADYSGVVQGQDRGLWNL